MLQGAGQPVPKPFQARALVDTGASCTCVDPEVLIALGLSPTGSTPMHTPSTGDAPVDVDQYDVGLIIPPAVQGQPPLVFGTVPVAASKFFQAQGIHALIGRDILRHCVLHYNGGLGPTGHFTIAF